MGDKFVTHKKKKNLYRSHKMQGYRNWCFTSYREEPFVLTDRMTYIIFQKEVCPTTKKEHWQGYVEFEKVTSMKMAKKELEDPQVHLEPRKGTQQQAIDYCKKKDSRKENSEPIIFGTPKKQGARNDLDSMVEAILFGATKLELLKEFKGNALRHLGMIDRAQKATFGKDSMDKYIHAITKLGALDDHKKLMSLYLEKNTEVAGNTESATNLA